MADSTPAGPGSGRIQSIDILRGVVIVLMVLDHIRDFIDVSGYAFDPLDPQRTTVLLYVTRWVTHFCAPTFVFLAGVSSWLQLARGKDKRALSWLLLTRGLWLILLENTVIGFGWSFSIPYLFYLQVIWAIGWSMVALAGLVWLPRPAVLAFGLAIIAGHNLLDGFAAPKLGAFAYLWEFLESSAVIQIGHADVFIGYPILAWLGVMCFGYGIGPLFLLDPPRRDRIFVRLGLFMLAVFLVLRLFNLYGDPNPWQPQGTLRDTLMVFFNVNKYPPSLLYVCATLGPVLLSIPLIERWRGPSARFFMTFGSVPFFAYVVHLYLAHSLAIAVELLVGANPAGLFNVLYKGVLHPEQLDGTGVPLYLTYLTWMVVIATLYPLCRWFSAVKRRRRDWWLGYV
jgi:uncharacterized membrane protein